MFVFNKLQVFSFFKQNLTTFLQLHCSYMPQNKEFPNDYLMIISTFRFFQAGKKKTKMSTI